MKRYSEIKYAKFQEDIKYSTIVYSWLNCKDLYKPIQRLFYRNFKSYIMNVQLENPIIKSY